MGKGGIYLLFAATLILFQLESGAQYGKAGKAAVFYLNFQMPMLTLSQSGGADYTQPLAFPHLNYFVITPLRMAKYAHRKTSSPTLFENAPPGTDRFQI